MDVDSCLSPLSPAASFSGSSSSSSLIMATSLTNMSEDELSNWLKTVGKIPEKYSEVFSGIYNNSVDSISHTLVFMPTRVSIFMLFLENYIDGEAFVSLTEKDIKEMVPPIGLVKKILKLREVNCLSSCQSVLTDEMKECFYLRVTFRQQLTQVQLCLNILKSWTAPQWLARLSHIPIHRLQGPPYQNHQLPKKA